MKTIILQCEADGLIVQEGSNQDYISLYADKPIKPEDVDKLLDDIGFEFPETRTPAKEYCLQYIKDINEGTDTPELDGVKERELDPVAVAFIVGYETCLEKHGFATSA